MPIDSKIFLDSSVWIAYFFGESAKAKELIDNLDSVIFTSAVSLFEVKKRLLLKFSDDLMASSSVELIKSKSIVVDASQEIFENAAVASIKHKLHALDAIIFESALEVKAVLLTFDSHFAGKDNATVLNGE